MTMPFKSLLKPGGLSTQSSFPDWTRPINELGVFVIQFKRKYVFALRTDDLKGYQKTCILLYISIIAKTLHQIF
mgnify:CR=1 FL=1